MSSTQRVKSAHGHGDAHHGASGTDRQPIRLSVVIPTWNAAELAATAVRYLMRDGLPEGTELIVVDDGSDDERTTRLLSAYPAVTVLRHDENRGFGAAVNTGFRFARGAFLAAVNNDALVSWDVLGRIVAFLEHEPRAGAGAPRIVAPDGRPYRVGFDLPRGPWRRIWPFRQTRTDTEPGGRVRQAEYLKGACVVFSRRALQEVGLFDEQFHMFAEEIDLFHRLAAAGWTAWVVHDVQAVHGAGVTTRNHPDAMIAERFRVQSYRSLCRYYLKHHSWLGAACLRGALGVRLCGRFLRALVSGPRWGDPRGAGEIVKCLRVVLQPSRSAPIEPVLGSDT